MTHPIARTARHLAAACLLLGLAACSQDSLPTDPAPTLAKVNGKNGFGPFNIAFPDGQICAAHGGFDVWTELTGYLKTSSVTQRPDGSLRVVEILSNGRITLSANGKSLSAAMGGTAFYVVDPFGNLSTITFVGSQGVFTVPKVGRVAAETGTLVIDVATGQVVRETGHHDVFGNSPDVAKLCQYLN